MLSQLFLVRAIVNGRDKSVYIKAEKLEEALDIAIFYFDEGAIITGLDSKMAPLFEPDEEEVLP